MTYRIVQWTTGNVGKRSVRAIAMNPALELVGCYAWSADKVGRDVGDLCGIELLGVTATNDLDALVALRPDCDVYKPMFADVDEMCRIPRAGINIVSTSEFITGHFFGEGRDRIAKTCTQGAATIFGSGINRAPATARLRRRDVGRLHHAESVHRRDARDHGHTRSGGGTARYRHLQHLPLLLPRGVLATN